MLAPWKKSYDKPRHCIKEQRHHLANKDLYSESCGFSSSHVWMWELNHKESWALKNWCFQTVILETTLGSPLDSKENKQVKPKGGQSWIFIRKTDAEAEAPVLWPPDAKSPLIGKDPDAGKDWRQEKKGMSEDKMVGQHYQLNAHEFEQALGVDGQRSPVFYSPWGCRVRRFWTTKTTFKNIFLIYLAALGLPCYTQAFSTSDSWASPCGGLSLWNTGSRNTGFSSSNRWA